MSTINHSHDPMKEKEPMDALDSLIQQAQPEMARMQHAAEIGFETRLRTALGPQASIASPLWEGAIRRGLRVAVCFTALIVVQSGFWLAGHAGDGLLQADLVVARLLLGI